MARKRDNFKISTTEKLRARVGNRCSNPNCRVPTTGPTEEPEKVNVIGIAAHITAASPGGPRFDESLSSKERKSISNAIWLCSNCSIKIYRDTQYYSVEKLKNWKKQAEDKSKVELGNKLPDDNYVIQSLSSTLTGQSSVFLPKLPANACYATSDALEQLDTRFKVKTNFLNGITHFDIFAREKVDARIDVKPDFAIEFIEKYTNLQHHGEKLVIDSSALDIKGSPLLQKLTTNLKGKFEFSPALKKSAIIKVWLVSPDSASDLPFYDLFGSAVLGTKSMTVEGSALDGLVSMSIRLSIDNFIPTDGTFTFSLNFKKWDNQQLAFLPYFNRIYDLYCKINEGWMLHSSLEIEGLKISSGHTTDIVNHESFKQAFSHLHFVHLVKEISNLLNIPLHYDDSFEYNSQFYSRVNEIYEILFEGISFSSTSIKDNAKCNIEANEDLSNIKAIREAGGRVTSIRFDQLESEEINPFNQKINLPKFSHILTEVMPKIKSDLNDITPGDLIEIEWEPTENCKYKIEKM